MEKTAVSFLNRVPPTPTQSFDVDEAEGQAGKGQGRREAPASASPVVGRQIPATQGPDH